ncbi:MAG: hypothetical protein E6I76_13455 [Chloroflexi bacterium]|nr:MAG: hypothetical protein E6I76_13455 [Chloroflexota bacterium]
MDTRRDPLTMPPLPWRVGGDDDTDAERRVRDAEQLAQRRLVALSAGRTIPLPRRRPRPQAWRPSQSRVAL